MKVPWHNLTFRTCALGVALTLAVVTVDRAGFLTAAERWCYDRRARYFQYFTPPPTDRLVHLDIDDAALETIGRWPWDRGTLADVIDEVRLAGAEALSIDMIFPEGQDARWVPVDPDRTPPGAAGTTDAGSPIAAGSPAGTDPLPAAPVAQGPGDPAAFTLVDPDAKLAAALRRFGRVLVPVSFDLDPRPPRPPAYSAAVDVLATDLERSREEVAGRLPGGPPALSEDAFVRARREALARRIAAELAGGIVPPAALRPRLLPRMGSAPDTSSLARQYAEVYRETAALRSVGRFALPPPPVCPPLIDAGPKALPLPEFAGAAWASGFVDYLPLDDGTLRGIPLWVNFGGRLYPQMDLALACAVLGTDVRDVRIGPDELVIPTRGGRPVVVPVRTVRSRAHGEVGSYFDVPWFGGPEWQTMYDHPGRREPRQHVPVTKLWGQAESRRAVARSQAQIAQAVALFAETGSTPAGDFLKQPPDPNDFDGWAAKLAPVIPDAAAIVSEVEKVPAAEWTESERRVVAAAKALRTAMANIQDWKGLNPMAAELRATLAGKVVLFGGTATALYDFRPTSLHPQCPGVVVHGVVFNALVTGHFWRTAPGWVTGLATFGMGLLVTGAKAWLDAWKAFVVTLLLAAGYVLVNGLLLFDYGDRIVGLAGPLLATGVVWGLLTLSRYLAETRERARITRRFQRYVDPALVNYLIDHPELARFDGEVREMSVMFTDLAGYTSLTEKLRERAVKILGRYKALMVPAIRKHRGLIHAFMGDGIMASYGAPIPNEQNAADAVATALAIQAVTAAFNEELAADGHDRVVTRVGICTGPAVVGDSGSDEGSDYACLGNTTNLAARLESANKAVGTTIMLSGRTVELAGDRYLVRPIARMVVKGKTEWEMTYELLAPAAAATAEQRQLAAMTTEMFEAYVAARFEDCGAAADRLEAAFGPSKLAALYRDACTQYRDGVPATFQGQIVLREK